jgi:hypothetical protein
MARAKKSIPHRQSWRKVRGFFPLPISFHLHFIFIIKDHFTSKRRERENGKESCRVFSKSAQILLRCEFIRSAVRTLLLQINKEKTKRERGAIKQKYISSTSLCQSAQKRFSYGRGASVRFRMNCKM